mmetsp:Transcript_110917/g.318640  ORF Transcript_110917/g.318640 Transcript_110917/m.318640 type:complete len:230 (-) Transcript_110917:501-1190(-)
MPSKQSPAGDARRAEDRKVTPRQVQRATRRRQRRKPRPATSRRGVGTDMPLATQLPLDALQLLAEALGQAPVLVQRGHQVDRAGRPSEMHTHIDEILEADGSDLVHIQQPEKGLCGARIEIHQFQCVLHVLAVELAPELVPIHLAVAIAVRFLEDLPDVVDHVNIPVALRRLHRCLNKDAGHNVHNCQEDESDVERKDDPQDGGNFRHEWRYGVVPANAPRHRLVQGED